MVLYFENSSVEKREIGQPTDKDEALELIKEFCTERNFTIPYIRTWGDDCHTYYDVGSWTQLFVLEHFISESISNDSLIESEDI